MSQNGHSLLVQNLNRLEDTLEEDQRGINLTIEILKNLIEIKPTLGPKMCEETEILSWLLKRVRSKTFDENKLSSSELLNMLANSDSSIQNMIGNSAKFEGVDLLLQACAIYRRKEPFSAEEEECIENIFGTLSAVLMVSENQTKFRRGEGFELMIRFLREKKYTALCAIKVIDYAITNNAKNCEHMVESGGLKAIFPVFMGRAAARKLKKSKKLSKGEVINFEEHCISIMATLALYLEDRRGHDCLSRFISKFLEDGMEKIDRVVELYVEYSKRMQRFESSKGETKREEAEDERESNEIEMGIYAVQRLAAIMTVVAGCSSAANSKLEAKFVQLNMSVNAIKKILDMFVKSLGEDSAGKTLKSKLLALMPVEEN